MIVLALEEFASKRRTEQATLEKSLHPYVEDAVDTQQNTNGWQELLKVVRRLYAEVYSEESGQPKRHPDTRWTDKLLTTLQKTKNRDENSVERITVWLATAILSKATQHAAKDDPEELFLEWVDMGDSHVRETHRKANGQQRPIGDKFSVGGEEMEYPGDPSVEPSLWMNCRCTVRPVLASEVLVASAFVSNKPWDGSASRFTPEQWKASCVLHVCDGPEKSCHKLPIKEPGGELSRAGVHAAAGRIGSANGPPDKIASAKSALRGAYKQLGEEPPDSLTAAGGDNMDPELDAPVADDAVDLGDDDLVAQVPWHGILAPEGIASGDGRRFLPNSLTWRDLPLPLTWQKSSSMGHDGSVVVGKIEKIEMQDGMARASGHMIDNDESDELVGMIAEFGKFGVSVDADQTVMEMPDEPADGEESMDSQTVDFAEARICSASVVAIPAFAEAYIALGPWDEADQTAPDPTPVANPADVAAAKAPFPPKRKKKYDDPNDPNEDPDDPNEDMESPEEEDAEDDPKKRKKKRPFPAAASEDDLLTFAPGTEDGPGWLTHPVDTDRLRDYWVRGAGAAKIGWGVAGDFNRCRLNLAKYVKPNYLSGYCANRHKDALGVWPGQEAKARDVLTATEQSDAIHLVAAAGTSAPAAWFRNPELQGPTHLTVTDEGQVYGHIARWDSCHIGFKGVCTAPPRSATNYAYFLTGQVRLDDGTRASTGPLTIGGGHASPKAGLRAATEHYDDVCVAVADVTVGEDAYGIWCSGWVRPGVNDQAVTALMASDVSGDWRAVGGNLELVAALAVNTGGFPTPRTALAASAEGQTSLVAAGIIHEEKPVQTQSLTDDMVNAVLMALEKREAAQAKMAALRQKYQGEV